MENTCVNQLAFFWEKSYNISVYGAGTGFCMFFLPHFGHTVHREAEDLRTVFEKYRELILYVFFGGLTTLVDWVSYWLMTDIIHVPYMAAAFLSQIFSILFAYVTNRSFVFESRVRGARAVAVEMIKFFGARGASLLLNMLVMYVGVDMLHINDKVIKVIASVLVIIANYIFSKLFVFRSAGHGEQGEDPNGKKRE